MKRSKFAAAVIVAAVSSGCAGGEQGERDRLRFSQNMLFPEAPDFAAGVAVGRPLWVSPQNPPAHPGEEGEFRPDLSLRVHREGEPESDARVPPKLEVATWQVTLDHAGEWALLAEDERGEVVDRLAFRAHEVTSLRVSRAYKVVTRDPAGRCSTVASLSEGLEQFELHRNQLLQLHAVPLGGQGQPLIGLLDLQVTAPGFITAAPRAPQRLRTPNAVEIEPALSEPLGGTAELVVREGADGPSFSYSLKTKDADAPVECR